MLKRIALWLFKSYCHPDFQEDILGDLDEYYELNLSKKGKRYANVKFLADVILLFRLSLLKKQLISKQPLYTAMVKNIFKTALRVFWRERAYSVMNILGLTVGITASVLLLLYVQSEKSVNKFHKDIDQIYQVMSHQTYEGRIRTFNETPGPLVTTFKDEMPEIEYMAAYSWPMDISIRVEERGFREAGRFASEDFFKIFDVDFIEGQNENTLIEPTAVYISKSLKERLFGLGSALSASIEVDSWGQFQVGGVFEDIPNESTMNFDIILPYQPFREVNSWLEGWDNSGVRGIVKLSEDAEMSPLNEKIKDYVAKKLVDQESNVSIFLQPLQDRYLHNNFENGTIKGGRIVYVKLLAIVAYFILFIACINFVNLATARSTKRAKEVGVKKVVGSTRAQLHIQFMTESILLSLISTTLAGVLVMAVLEPLNLLVGKSIVFSVLDFKQASWLLSIGLLVGVLAGIYPSFVLSRFKTLSVLKGSFRTSGWSKGVRKALVVFQFTISTVLIISTLIIRNQLQYITSKNLGYDKEHLIAISMQGTLRDRSTQQNLKTSLLSNPNFTHVSFSGGTPLAFFAATDAGFTWEGKQGDLDNNFNVIRADADFVDTYGMEIIEGRNFNEELASDTLNFIINEEAARIMNVEDPLTKTVSLWGSSGRIVGIVKDFHFQSLHEKIGPAVLHYRPNLPVNLTVRITGQNIAESLDYLESKVVEFNPNYPVDYTFLDEDYEQLYQSETTIGTLTDYFSTIAVFISLLGLFGLSSFTAEQRTKEIGIRKILGADSLNLISITSKGFLFLVGLGFLIAIPISFSFMSNWLATFEYSVKINLSIFLLAAIITILITILTISYHALKAAYANPVHSLRYE